MARTKQTAMKCTGGKQRPSRLLATKAAMAAQPKSGSKKPRRYQPGTVAIREIKRLQGTSERLVPKAPSSRLIREIQLEYKRDIRATRDSDDAQMEMAENYLVGLMDDSCLPAIHRKRQTIMPKDMLLAMKIQKEDLWQVPYIRPKHLRDLDRKRVTPGMMATARCIRGERS